MLFNIVIGTLIGVVVVGWLLKEEGIYLIGDTKFSSGVVIGTKAECIAQRRGWGGCKGGE